ncbi:alpha/beta fold hydrolase [Paenibacillus sp. y28]|uniref:alpha/beta fold hydrolase n=1 Tax=Paenibacillus sp. y28 TaxID=3129110 RepID=UPI00301A0337
MLNMLWVHGWGASPELWRQDVERELPQHCHVFFSYKGCRTIAEARHRLLEVLNRGQGEASIEDQAAPGQPWVVVGWSLGGLLALDALHQDRCRAERLTESAESFPAARPVALDGAQRTADRESIHAGSPHRLILVDSTLRFADRDRSRGWPPRVLARMREQLAVSPQETLEQFARSMFTAAELQQPVVSALLQLWCSDMNPELLLDGLGYLEATDLTPIWPLSARIQVHWIHGGSDSICPQGAIPAETAAEALLLPDAGHAPFLTSPERFYAGIRSFLE